jgi:hypothetical protein
MARERRLPSARSSATPNNKQAKVAAETQDHAEKPAIERDDTSHTATPSVGNETQKHDDQQQSSSSEVEDTRTFQQLVHDYGDDSKWHFRSTY